MKKTLLYIGLVIISTVFGYAIWEIFTSVSFYQMQIENITFVFQRMTSQFYQHMIFAFSFGLVPVLFLLVYKFAKLDSLKQRLITIGIIIFSGLIFWQYRILQLNYQFDFSSEYTIDHFRTTYMTEGLKLEIYLLIGLIIGSMISLIIFRYINRNIDNKRVIT